MCQTSDHSFPRTLIYLPEKKEFYVFNTLIVTIVFKIIVFNAMKINECTLAAFATSHIDAPPDKEGWLWKKGEVNKVITNI